MISHSQGDLIFEAGEDLLNESKTQVIVFKQTSKSIEIIGLRTIQSYCYEFCGITGLSFHTLRFQNIGRDVKQETIINDSVYITVLHKSEFTIEPPNSLKSSMKSMLMSGLYSDVTLKLSSDKSIKAHKCVLYMRSKPLKDLIDETDKPDSPLSSIDLSNLIKDDEATKESFINMINFLYSGEIVFPKNPLEVVKILKLAKEYQIEDLEEICEEEIIKKIDNDNVLDILLAFEKDLKASEESNYKIRSHFLKNFESISNQHIDIEERLYTIPGLVKKLFLHISGKKKFKRKVTFVDYDLNVDSHEL